MKLVLASCSLFVLFLGLAIQANAQGRPDILWMRGGIPFGVSAMDYSSDGQLFASVESGYSHIKIWRNSDGILIRTIRTTCQNFTAQAKVAFTSDGQDVLVSCLENTRINVKRHRVSDGVLQQTYGDEMTFLAFQQMPDGSIAIASNNVGDAQDSIKFFNFATGGAPFRTITNVAGVGATAIASVAAFSDNGRIAVNLLTSTSGAYNVVVIDVNGSIIGYRNSGFGTADRLSRDGVFLVTSLDRFFLVSQLCNPTMTPGCNPNNPPPVGTLPPRDNLSFSPSGQFVAGTRNTVSGGFLEIYLTSNFSLFQSIPIFGPGKSIFSPDSQTVAINSRTESPTSDYSVKFLQVSNGALLRRLESYTWDISHVLFSPVEQAVATVSAAFPESTIPGREKIIRIRDLSDGTLLRSITTGQTGGSSDQNQLAGYSPNGQFIYHGSPLFGVQKWRVSNGNLEFTIPVAGTRGIAVSPNGQLLATINPTNYNITLHRTSDGGLERILPPPTFPVDGFPPQPASTFSIAFTNDSQTVVVAHPFVFQVPAQGIGIVKGYIRFYNVGTGAGTQPVETVTPYPRSLAISPDGQTIAIVGSGLCGAFCQMVPTTALTELRRVTDGSLIRNSTERPFADTIIKFTPDGQKIVTAGFEPAIRFWNVNDLTPAQMYDEELTNRPAVNVRSIAFSSDGSKFAYGRDDATLVTARNPFATLRTPFDFDGDGKTDFAIFRPSIGVWWWMTSSDGNVGTRLFFFGAASDIIAPADVSGDGKTDLVFFRPSTGQWFIQRSEDNTFSAFQFGTNGDIPAPGDFDGDGKADEAVFRPSTGIWYIRQSSNGQTRIEQFGLSGDQPVTADYDGDGRADVAIWRPSQGIWFINRSTAGVVAFQFGQAGDKTVAADHTGDGKADVAVWRPANGTWYVLRSEDFALYAFPFGANGDQPTPGDYDGDGKADAAVFRPTNGMWFVLPSSGSPPVFMRWGTNGDRAIPNAFVR